MRELTLTSVEELVERGRYPVVSSGGMFLFATESGRHDLAEAIVCRWERIMPEEIEAKRARAINSYNLGNYGGAILQADAVLTSTPGDELMLNTRAKAIEKLNSIGPPTHAVPAAEYLARAEWRGTE